MGQNIAKRAISDEVFKRETTILKHLQPCANGLDKEFERQDRDVLLDRINEFKIQDELDERFYDQKLMGVITCLYGNLWVVDRNLFHATDKDYFRITNNYSGGIAGAVFLAKKGGSDLKFIIKANMHPAAGPLAVHELFIGLVITNKLRAYCPNFSFIYGGFVCGTPNVSTGQICDGNTEVPYMVYEYINGKTLRSYLNDIYEPLEIIAIILQIYFALRIAKEKGHDFAHRDLHVNNIILRPLKQKMAIRYVFNNINSNGQEQEETYYVYSKFVATMIDYGFSEVYLPIDEEPDEEDINERVMRFGEDQFPDPVIDGKQISHVRDLMKLLGFISGEIQDNNVLLKDLILNFYLEAVKPYILDGWKGVTGGMPYALKLEVLKGDTKDYYSPGDREAEEVLAGRINFDNFLSIVTKYMLKQDLAKILAVGNGQDKQKLDFPVLECDEKCLDVCSTFSNIMLRDPEGQAEKAIKSGIEDLAYYAEDAQTSYQRFRDNKEYRPYIQEKIIAAKAELTKQPQKLRELNVIIYNKLIYLEKWMLDITNIVDRNLYYQDSTLDPYSDIAVYKQKLNLLFEFINTARQVIELNNGIVALGMTPQHRAQVIKTISKVNTFIEKSIYPMKANLAIKSNTGYFGDAKIDFDIGIVNQYPDRVILPAIQ